MMLYALNNLSDSFQVCRQETEAMVEQISSHTSFYVNLTEAPTVNHSPNSLSSWLSMALYALFGKLTTYLRR